MSIARQLLNQVAVIRRAESDSYYAREAVILSRGRFTSKVANLFKNLPFGFAHFDLDRLCSPGMQFLVINCPVDEPIQIVILTTGRENGTTVLHGSDGITYPLRTSRDATGFCADTKRSFETLAYQAGYRYGPSVVLPLSIPEKLKQHTVLEGMVDLADAIIRNDDADFLMYERAMSAHLALAEKQKETRTVLAQMSEGLSLPIAVNERLITDIKGMDWTYDYADRPSAASHEQERRIKTGLNAMDIDSAAVLLAVLSPGNTIAINYLMSHPDYARVSPAPVAKAA